MNIRVFFVLASAILLFVGAGCQPRAVTNNAVSRDGGNNTVIVNVNTSNANVPIIDLANTNDNQTSVNAGVAPLGAEVKITSTGFEPATVRVRVGGTVSWTNQDSNPHQPATDPHPAHTGLPGFDSLDGLSQGQVYQYTFSKAGTFSYHDHLNSFRRGTVIVR
ncbi:MAG: cupredoxin domain-containing protein [Candidatus Kerfeldbacteria bacterium]|nr:cupredoxin domain-containing protein [Candidatus Kerfeldbacteria bacterium]